MNIKATRIKKSTFCIGRCEMSNIHTWYKYTMYTDKNTHTKYA